MEWIEFEEEPRDTRYEIIYIPPWTKFSDLNTGFVVDTKHPRCFYCGRFVKVNWDRRFTGPCTFCYEDTSWL